MEPVEQLGQISQLIAPYLNRWGDSEIGDLAREIRGVIENRS